MFTKAWILLLLAELSFSIRVYLHPPPARELQASLPSTLTPNEARVVVSHHLGFDMFESLEDVTKRIEGLFLDGEFVGKGVRNAMLLTASEDVAREIVPASLKRSFSIPDIPSAASEISMVVSTYTQRAQHLYSNVVSPTLHSSSPFTIPRLIDVFSASPSSDSIEIFLGEMAQLVYFVEDESESESKMNNAFGAFELRGVSEIAREHGRQSEQFKLAAETTQAFFSSAMASEKLVFTLITYPGVPLPLSSIVHDGLEKRQPPQTPFPAPAPVPPVGNVASCYTTSESCTNATNSCSGRGECEATNKFGQSCFVCSCSSTTDSRGRKTHWVGEACQKEDISGPFALITGTVIGITLVAIGSVALLYSVGDEKLPSVLSASASVHLKRE